MSAIGLIVHYGKLTCFLQSQSQRCWLLRLLVMVLWSMLGPVLDRLWNMLPVFPNPTSYRAPQRLHLFAWLPHGWLLWDSDTRPRGVPGLIHEKVPFTELFLVACSNYILSNGRYLRRCHGCRLNTLLRRALRYLSWTGTGTMRYFPTKHIK